MRRGFAVGLLAVALADRARCQELTEEQFLAGVAESHVAVRALQEGLGIAEAARIRAGTLDNPRLEFWREQPESNPRLTNWTLAWTPPLDGRFGLAKNAAAEGVAAARERLAGDRARLRQELRRVFAEWSLAAERRTALDSQAEVVTELAESERQRARVGEAAGLSARRFTLAQAEAQALLREAEAELARAEAIARAWRADLGPGKPIVPSLVEPIGDLEASPPEVRALAHEAEQRTLEAKRAGRFWGFPTLQVGWQRLDDRGSVFDGPIFAASWSVPLLDRGRAAQLEAQTRRDATQARLELVRARATAEVQGNLAAYRSLLTSAREARAAADQTAQVIDAARASYRAGEASVTDVLDAIRSAFGAKVRALEIQGRALDALRALELALGRPLSGGAQP